MARALDTSYGDPQDRLDVCQLNALGLGPMDWVQWTFNVAYLCGLGHVLFTFRAFTYFW